MPARLETLWLWLWITWTVAGMALEVYAVATKGIPLSDLVWVTTRRYPLLALAMGLLMGHFFWQKYAP
jgi:hypothetical protein